MPTADLNARNIMINADYCSSVCCMYALKEAIVTKERFKDDIETTIFYMDMRTFGKDFDKYNLKAEDEAGVRFVRSRIHSVYPTPDDRLRIVYATDAGSMAEETFDIVVLSVGLTADPAAVDVVGVAEEMAGADGHAVVPVVGRGQR